MAYISLKSALNHLNIEEVSSCDNEYITDLIGVAEAVVERDVCRSLESMEDKEGKIPAPLKHAILLLVGHYYDNREPVAFAHSSKVPLSYEHLVNLYKKYN